jgi:peptidyl-prolyl cis-trans isomerase D
MLDSMRRNAQSWMVKALFAIIVLVFVFWGVGGFQGNRQAVLATVNDSPIRTKEFYRLYEQRVQALRQQREDVSSEDLRRMDFKRQLFNRMVSNRLLLQQARELGFVVGADELRTEIKSMPVFQGENKEFDPERYKTLLSSNNISPGQFESDLTNDLLIEKMRSYIREPARVGAVEARSMFDYVQEQARVRYLQFAWQDFTDRVSLSENEIKTHYENHQDKYRQPERMRMEYLLLTPEALAPYQKVEDGEIERYYARHKEAFTRKERVKVRHILIKVDSDASEQAVREAKKEIQRIGRSLKEDVSFAEAAENFSQGPSASKGGSLGWITRGETVKPFEEAAFNLQPGNISEPVRTPFGWHLIKVTDRKSSGVQPLSEVRSRVRERIARNKASDNLENLLDKALETLFTKGSLDRAAEAVGADVETSDLFSRNQPPQGLSLDSDALDTLFAMQEGEVTDVPITLEKGYLLAEKTKGVPSRVEPLQDVRSSIERALKREKAFELAEKRAKDRLQALQEGSGEQAWKERSTVSKPFNRRGRIPGLGANAEMVRDAFAAETGQWLPATYRFETGYVVARLQERIPPSEKAWKEQRSFWISYLTRDRAQTLFQSYIEGLRSQASIEIVTPKALEY